MARTYGMTSKIRPGLDLRRIVIDLDPFSPPKVELHGRTMTGNIRVDSSSASLITTLHLPPSGKTFIEEMKAAFGGANNEPAAPEGEKRVGRRTRT